MIIIICIGIFIPFLFFSKSVRVGDGAEYYALSLAWRTTHKPFMTDASWLEYGRLFDSGEIAELANVSRLKSMFPALRLGSTADFNHFWFYSFCAAVISKLGAIVGIDFSIHKAFLLFHCLLLASTFLIAWRCYGWKGIAAAIVLTFLSPIIWYLDKVHTEWFTFCVTTSAVILLLKRRYIFSALFLALAATQNISFSVMSLFVLGFGMMTQRKEKYSLVEVALIVPTMIILALQPSYYYSRLGILTPQMFAGGAKIGGNLQYAYIWIFDPDIGLLPNWPFGILFLVLSLIALRGKKLDRLSNYLWLAFVMGYICMSLWAQSSTTNLNSGATPGLARYSLWYLALFFPAILIILNRIKFSRWISVLAIGLLTSGIFLNFQLYNPSFHESYSQPTPVSLFIQSFLPNMYNPPPEIFAERYGGVGENSSIWDSIAVFGPDCRKFLFINPALPGKEQAILGGKGCVFDYEKLKGVLVQKNQLYQNNKVVYGAISEEEQKESTYTPHLGEWFSAALNGNATGMMETGWSVYESWGTWSQEKRATIMIPCPLIEDYSKVPLFIDIEVQPFIAPAHPQVDIIINIGNIQGWSGTLDKAEIIQINLPTNTCVLNDEFLLSFLIDNPASPASLGLSGDQRELGVGLLRIRFDIVNPE